MAEHNDYDKITRQAGETAETVIKLTREKKKHHRPAPEGKRLSGLEDTVFWLA